MSGRRRRKVPRAASVGRESSQTIYPTLDLHGYSEAEAMRLCARWLEECAEDGEPAVRVITGRGSRSVGLPVLPGAIESLLRSLQGRLVRSYEPDASGGAYHVRLLFTGTVPTARSPSPPRLDSELVRQAEDSLADLGIISTPALIEAEARRILAERKRGSG